MGKNNMYIIKVKMVLVKILSVNKYGMCNCVDLWLVVLKK